MKKTLILQLMILLLMMSACSSAQPTAVPAATEVPATSAPATEAPTDAAPPAPTWEPILVADTSATANFPDSGKFVENGKNGHYIVFKEGNVYEIYDGGFRVASGTYKVEGNVYTELSSDSNCGPLMSFTYQYDGTNLTYNYIDDPQTDTCNIRVPDYNNATYSLAN